VVKIPQSPRAAAQAVAQSVTGVREGAAQSAGRGVPGGEVRGMEARQASPGNSASAVVDRVDLSSGREPQGEALANSIEQRSQRLQKSLQDQAERANEQISGGSHKVQVAMDDRSGRFVMKVVDSESGHVVRQFPPESLLKVSERLDELSGMLLAKEA